MGSSRLASCSESRLPRSTDPNLYSGIRIVLGDDAEECDYSESLCSGGDYDFYDVEVVNRQGFDSFIPDHGVLIAKSKTADASPFIWVIDAFPRDIKKTDYTLPDGTKVPYTIGDYRQLSDAAFHVGTAKGTKNLYVDETNGFAFFILEKENLDGRLAYTVAVQSLTAPALPSEAEVTTKKHPKLKRKKVKPVRFEVTNTGVGDAVYILSVKAKRAKTRLLNNLLFLTGGETKTVTVWAKAKKRGKRPKVTLGAKAFNS